ncbi:MAG TPA: methylated-DNA--[protein]-cysteine S-methyltransferase [Anaerolineae bacterium]|nr:methylated-DNA--[protein]-cysteine S-methyltransferase [Anaerolineae bacterium]
MSKAESRYETIPSRFGELTLVWSPRQQGPIVTEILLPLKAAVGEKLAEGARRHPGLDSLVDAIRRYLGGEDVPLPADLVDRSRCSPFQWSVLMAERTIPRGFVTSYRRLAAHVGRPQAYRAVGTALARNPFPLVIPCHRTVRGDGSLGGFGGGLPMKRALLEMEGVGVDALGRVRPEFFWDWPLDR